MSGVSYHPLVAPEVQEFAEYYRAISGKLETRFRSELLKAIGSARDFPERHHFDASGLRRVNLKRFPVHLLFRIIPEGIRVTAIRHDRRDPRYGAGRR